MVKRLFLQFMPRVLMMRRTKYSLPEYDDTIHPRDNGYPMVGDMDTGDFPNEYKEHIVDEFGNMVHGNNLAPSVEENMIPRQLTPEVHAAIQSVRFIAQHMKDADKDNEVSAFIIICLFYALNLLNCWNGIPRSKF